MFGQDRDQLRRFFQTSWNNKQAGKPLQPLEQLVARVVEQHPEYHRFVEDPNQVQADFDPESGTANPWLHMGMHITIGEQLGADRPPGIRALYQKIARQRGDAHSAEHAIMDCLGAVLWQAQGNQAAPDEAAYLDCLKRILR